MKVRLDRERITDGGTLGRLFVDDLFLAFTLEPGGDEELHPRIAAGDYHVIITESARFHRRLPLIVGVPDRTGLRVHPGNTEKDTAGCLLLGYTRTGDTIGESAIACTAFQHLIAHPLASEETVPIEIHDPPVRTDDPV